MQSSQSDERVDSEEEFEEGDNGDETITADDAPPSEPAPQALSCAKPTTQDLDGDSDSDSSLEDLDAMLNRTQRTQERLPSPPATTSARSRRTGVFKGSYDVPQTFENILNKTNDTPAAKATPTPSCRYSLAKLVKQHKKDEQRRTAMEEAEAATLARKRQAEAIDVIVGNVDKNVLASVMKREDEEESSFSKVLQALERADVMTKQVEYSFFARDLDVTELPHPGELRLEGLPPDAAALFEDESARNECFLNGFAAELAMMDVFMKLDRQRLREWLPVAAMWEPREDLSQAYLRTSKTLTTHCDFARWMRPYPVEVMFQACGATSYKVDVNHRKHITPTHAPSCKASDNQRSRILRTLHVLEQITQSLLPDTLSYTCEILARLATDTQVVKKDVEVQVALQRALAAMFEQIQTDRSGDQCVSAFQG